MGLKVDYFGKISLCNFAKKRGDMAKTIKMVIVIPKGDIVVTSVTGTYKIFQAAADLSGQEIKLIIGGLQRRNGYHDGLFQINPSESINSISETDLIIIPAVEGNLDSVLAENRKLVKWIQDQYRLGATLASLCTGSFLLGAAGLLTGRRCTTHWLYSEDFQRMFPDSIFCKNSIITEDDRIFTSGGAFSFLNLVVYLVEIYFGKGIAREIINIYQVDQYRTSQAPFVKFESQKHHQDASILRVQQFIESHYNDSISNNILASVAQLSIRSMMRRFKSATGNTPIEYLQRVRIEKAKNLLTETSLMVSEIQHRVGYNDPKSFREVFGRYTGTLPTNFRKKYSPSI